MRKTHCLRSSSKKRLCIPLLIAFFSTLLILPLPATITAEEQLTSSSSVAQEVTYSHSAVAEQNGTTLTIYWDEPTLGQETHFHVVATNASKQATIRMDAPVYSSNIQTSDAQNDEANATTAPDTQNDTASEPVTDPTSAAYSDAHMLTNGEYSTTFTMTASGCYQFSFHLADSSNNVEDLQVKYGIEASDDSYPSVAQIVTDAVKQCEETEAKTDYEKALWLHDWLLEQVKPDDSLTWTSAEAALTRGTGSSQAYASTYAKLLSAADIENSVITDGDANDSWNAVKLDGKWYQVDCFLDDAQVDGTDAEKQDFDATHLYFGLTDELMSIAHSEHAKQYSTDDYATRSTSYENNYYVRHGEVQAWADAYTESIQEHLNAGDEDFAVESTLTGDETAISIINSIVAHMLQSMQWTTDTQTCTLDVTSSAAAFTIHVTYEPALADTAAQATGDDNSLIMALSSGRLTRIYGQLRYNTMGALVDAGGWSKGNCAVLASGEDYPDALAASALAGVKNAPILLTTPSALSGEASSRLSSLAPATVYIVGGVNAVSQGVENSVRSLLPNSNVVRIAGATRYETSLGIAQEIRGNSDTVIIATGGNYADALSVSPYAFKKKAPILLCSPSSGLTDEALNEVKTSGYTRAVIVGGTSAVSNSVEAQLKAQGVSSITRLAGSTRYETSSEIVKFELSAGLGFSMNNMLLTTGQNFPDALAAGPLAAKRSAPLLLVDPSGNIASSFLSSYRGQISQANVVGGPAAISNATATKVAAAMGIDFETPTYYGYQNPSQYYQVSNVSVTIPHQNQGIFGYRTPSKLSLNATRQDCVNALINTAYSYVGTTRYIWDYACAPGVGVDCAGLVMQCLYATGMDLGRYTPWDHYYTPGHNHYANDMWNDSRFKHVSFSERQVGDLVCYPGHIAIYIGNDKIIEAASPSIGVRVATVYVARIRGCLRPFV